MIDYPVRNTLRVRWNDLNYAGITGVNLDCPGQTVTSVHPALPSHPMSAGDRI